MTTFTPGEELIWSVGGVEVPCWYREPSSGTPGLQIVVFSVSTVERSARNHTAATACVPGYELRRKPTPEPLGLGAVVRDAHGALWVRANKTWIDADSGAWRLWDHMAQPVEVLEYGYIIDAEVIEADQ